MLTILSIVFLHDDSYRPIAKLTSSGGGTPILVDARTRSARIDFLRGVAIFAVLLLHFSLTYNLVDSPLSLILPAKWVRAAVGNGNYGVTLTLAYARGIRDVGPEQTNCSSAQLAAQIL